MTITKRLVRIAEYLAIAVILAGGIRTYSNAGRDVSASPGTTGFPAVTTHSNLDAFVGENQGEPSRGAVVFIGIDGASWSFINPLIERGLLPNLARIKKEGGFATLQSLPCYVSPPAWTTMFTGALPRHSGVYSFGRWNSEGHEFVGVNGDDVLLPRVWDIASYCGRKVGVFNVPMTYPPRPVNGVMVSGMMTPHETGDPIICQATNQDGMDNLMHRGQVATFSSVSRVAISDSLNTFLFSLYDTSDERREGFDTVVLTVVSGESRTHSYTFGVGEFSQWIRIRANRNGKIEDAWCKFAIARTEGDRYATRISPTFFAIDEEYTYPDSLAAVLQEKFGFYVPSPFVPVELITRMGRESAAYATWFYNLDDWDLFTYVFTQSDRAHHLTGFSPQAVEVYRTIDRFVGLVMETMDESGTLVIASDHGFRRYSYGIDLNHFFEERGLLERRADGSIDYDRTLVFHNIWHLYFNERLVTRDELAHRGINASDYDDPIEVFEDYLRGLCANVAPGVGVMVTPVAGDGTEDAPHMLVGGASGEYLVDFVGVEQSHDVTIRPLDGSQAWGHAREGIFMAWGQGIRRGHDLGVESIQDVAPTLLYMLGLPVTCADGAPIAGLFEKRLLATLHLHAVDDYSQKSHAPVVRIRPRESLTKKLRTLGYLR